MHLCLRIILDRESLETYSESEQEQLRQCVAAISAIEIVKEIKRHGRGGYTVLVDCQPGHFDEIMAQLLVSGYRPVL